MAKVVIFGTGVGADTAYRYLSADSDHEICAFTVDAAYLKAPTVRGLPVVPFESVVGTYPPAEYHMFVLLGFQGMNRARAEKYAAAKQKGYRFISYVHSNNRPLEPPRIGENCFILDGQIFNLDVAVGDNVTIWSGNHIGDRTRIGNHVWISSHVSLAGDVTIGDYSFLGVNSCVSNRVTLGDATFVGANVLIARDTAPRSVHVAPPSKEVAMASDRFLATLKIT